MTKIYTRGGDQGLTGTMDGERVPKDNFRIEAQGALDELNAQLGLLCAQADLPNALLEMLTGIQHDLFAMGAQLGQAELQRITDKHVAFLEQSIDTMQADLPELKSFILPGGGTVAAQCHVCRTVCRRAERRLVTLGKIEILAPELQQYVNRLSDLLFVAARTCAQANGEAEIFWDQER
ncbi:MAG TPA: cob(I)yrinic acid a,c-diamide adenosyltransferase [Chromatiales bacterium]|nr:cob(I)yrinic acid a,c-diamide adenosyltransferase [Thiotrichales bacterium]HIP69093.1 cob(I)yrinic acid a,c-diamide adenosyltransferase [Chromatiales bacterium]